MSPTGLVSLVGDEQTFLSEHWTHTPLLHRAASADAFAPVLTMAGFADVLTTGVLRLPHLRLVREGQQIAEGTYTSVRKVGHGTVTDAIDPAKVLSHFSIGSTLVLDAVELLVPAVRTLCDALAASLDCPVDAVAFLTPPSAKGLAPHIDDEDVFVLQLSGTKQWTVHEQLRPVPLKPRALTEAQLGPVALTTVLAPGDVMYVPRGTPHHAASAGSHSLHLSLAARRPTLDARVSDALRDALLEAGPDTDLDSLTPAAETEALVRARAADALDRLRTAAAPGTADEGDGLRTVLTGMAALATSGSRYSATGVVRLSDEADGQVLADFGRFRARLPAVSRPALERLAAGDAVRPEDFFPGSTGPVGQLLVRGAIRLTT
ncbi:cupin domain-containing protein [Streptomyces sp. NPDC091265]|uniref:cupin domain-containing protein n=1 Tax=unclassified Streptomyces TaxID=2593676 RepID=UPI00344BF43C